MASFPNFGFSPEHRLRCLRRSARYSPVLPPQTMAGSAHADDEVQYQSQMRWLPIREDFQVHFNANSHQ